MNKRPSNPEELPPENPAEPHRGVNNERAKTTEMSEGLRSAVEHILYPVSAHEIGHWLMIGMVIPEARRTLEM